MSKKKTSVKLVVSQPVKSSFANLRVNGVSVDDSKKWNEYVSFLSNDLGMNLVSGFGWDHQLRRMANEGLVSAIEFDAVTFIQGENANSVGFLDEELDDFAESFVNDPFLRNHQQHLIEKRDGTILESRNQNGEFIQKIKITTEEGIRDFSQGRIDRFSIGFHSNNLTCSVCGLDYYSYDCTHFRGREYGELGKCIVIFNKPEGVETSAVNVPAVAGTHILSLSEIDDRKQEVFMDKEEDVMEQDNHVLSTDEVDNTSEETNKLEEIAKELHLGDIDQRIGAIEELLNSFVPTFDALAEKVAQLEDEKNELAIQLAKFNGDLPPQYEAVSQTAKRLSWGSYGGSKLNINGTTPMPDREVREPQTLKRSVEAEYRQINKIELPENAPKRIKRGAGLLNNLRTQEGK